MDEKDVVFMVSSGVEVGGKTRTVFTAQFFETDDGRTFAGAAASSIWRFVVFIAFF